MTITSMDVANFYIRLFKDSDDPMTKVRLQRFLYYAQAESLVRLGRPLFEENFRAWHSGPVVPRVGAKFKDYANGAPILETVGDYDIHVFRPEEIEILMDVAGYCGRYSTAALSTKTQVKGGPWDAVHDSDGEPKVISKKSIKAYYSKNEPIPHLFSESIMTLETEGHVDPEGRFILPSDWE